MNDPNNRSIRRDLLHDASVTLKERVKRQAVVFARIKLIVIKDIITQYYQDRIQNTGLLIKNLQRVSANQITITSSARKLVVSLIVAHPLPELNTQDAMVFTDFMETVESTHQSMTLLTCDSNFYNSANSYFHTVNPSSIHISGSSSLLL